jgi:hypothetical protein
LIYCLCAATWSFIWGIGLVPHDGGTFTQTCRTNLDGFVKSRKAPFDVIPAKAGIQYFQPLLDPGFRRGDGFDGFLP